MTRDLATKIAGEIFDRVERDRTLIRQNIEEVIADGLLLGQAKAPNGSVGFAGNQVIAEEAKKLVKLLVDDHAILKATPRDVLFIVERMNEELRKAGWHA